MKEFMKELVLMMKYKLLILSILNLILSIFLFDLKISNALISSSLGILFFGLLFILPLVNLYHFARSIYYKKPLYLYYLVSLAFNVFTFILFNIEFSYKK